MAVVVVDKAEFGVVVFAGPLEGLGDITSRCDCAVGGVGIGGADVAGGAVDFADVLRQIPAVGVPGAALLDGQRARGDGLGGVTRRHHIAGSPLRGKHALQFVQSPSEPSGAFPGDIPQCRVGCAGEVERCNLQVAPVDVALVQRDTAVGGYLLRCAAAHVVVFAMDACAAAGVYLGKIRRAVLGIVADGPDVGAGLHAGLVAGGIRHAGGTPGNIGHRGGGIAPAIRLRVDDTAGGVLARGGGGDTCRVLLRERKPIHRHRLSGDAAGRHCTVLRPFRSFIIDTPLHGSQATFANKPGQTHWQI